MADRESLQRQDSGETVEAHDDRAEQSQGSGKSFTSKGAIPPVLSGFQKAGPSASERAFGRDDDAELRDAGGMDAKADAEKRRDQRFDNDGDLDEIAAGTRVFKNGDSGRAVTKLQVALLDLGYLKGTQIDGQFGGDTEKALKKFQGDVNLGSSGEFDAATLASLRAKFGTRAPYVALSKHNEAGVHRLHADEKAEALEAMVPRKPGEKFEEEVAGEKYGPKVVKRLSEQIAKFHGQFVTHAAMRDKPKENFHSWKDLEGACHAGKTVTDKVYGGYTQKAAFTHSNNKLLDMFEDEKARNATLKPEKKKEKAENFVRYLINSQCAEINKVHHADVEGADEKPILDPIVESFVDTDDKVQGLLEIRMDWPGAERAGNMMLQVYKSDTDDKNREALWKTFHTSIHEYIHALANKHYFDWANELGGAQYHTLVEGFCDYFTLNVRSQLAIDDNLQKEVEGSFYDKDKPLPPNADGSTGVGVYNAHAQAEEVVSIVGIRNAQEAYFCGDVAKMGAGH